MIGVLLGIAPDALLPLLAVWIAVVLITGFVGLATMVAVAAFPVYVALVSDEPSVAYLAFGIAMVLFVCYTHRSNIERMRSGCQSQTDWSSA